MLQTKIRQQSDPNEAGQSASRHTDGQIGQPNCIAKCMVDAQDMNAAIVILYVKDDSMGMVYELPQFQGEFCLFINDPKASRHLSQ